MITVPDWVIVSATRYALGRSSYVVEDTRREIRGCWRDLDAGTRELLREEVDRYLSERAHVRGVDDSWRDLLEWIRTQERKDA